MSDWYEVFDNEEVQQATRKRVGRAILTVALGLVATVTLIPLLLVQSSTPAIAISAVFGGLALLLTLVSRRMLLLRRVVWCIKLSVHRVVGYDYARRKTVLTWPEIERVDVSLNGLEVVGRPSDGRPATIIHIPTLFTDYPRLSHRLVEYAEAHGVPICVEGRPWQLLDLPTLYPFMQERPVMERPGGSLFGDPDRD
jgi:hypothetical protein